MLEKCFHNHQEKKENKKITIQRHRCTRDPTYYAHPLPPRPPLLYHDLERASALFLRKISPIRTLVHCFLFYYPFHEKESHASLHDDGLPDGGERGSLGMVQGMDVHHRKMGGKDCSGCLWDLQRYIEVVVVVVVVSRGVSCPDTPWRCSSNGSQNVPSNTHIVPSLVPCPRASRN